MRVFGIDGCRGGWLVAEFANGGYDCQLYTKLDEIAALTEVNLVFIDMPIGLSSEGQLRTIEVDMRRLLGKHQKSSVFTPPSRPAIKCGQYDKAREINKRITGKSISIQAWNIAAKINELDQLISPHPDSFSHTYEAHPEICFNALKGDFTSFKKKSIEGQDERKQILGKWVPDTDGLIKEVYKTTSKADVAIDDILDALCLCVSAQICARGNMQLIRDTSTSDELGIPIRVAYPSLELLSNPCNPSKQSG